MNADEASALLDRIELLSLSCNGSTANEKIANAFWQMRDEFQPELQQGLQQLQLPPKARAAMLAAIRVIEANRTLRRTRDTDLSRDVIDMRGDAIDSINKHESATLAELRRLTKGE